MVAWDLLNQWTLVPGDTFDPATSTRTTPSTSSTAGWSNALGAERVRTANARGPNATSPWRALVNVSEGADLLVVGARGAGGFLGLRIGSVSERVPPPREVPDRDHPCRRPERVADRGAHRRRRRRIRNGARALAWALDEARARHAKVRVVSAWSVPVMAYPGAMEGAAVFDEAADEIVHDAVRDADVHDVIQPIECETVAGGAASALIDAAKDATLVVVGSRGLSRARELILGSVSHQVVHHSPCPVVVIRAVPGGET